LNCSGRLMTTCKPSLTATAESWKGLMGQASASFTGAGIGVKAALARQARELTALPVVEAARRASVCTRRACGLLWGTTTPRHIG
jgi:hypothetical protein